jgi:hypothetical protein
VAIDPPVEQRSGLVVFGVLGRDHPPPDVGSELRDRDTRWAAHDGLLPRWYQLRPRNDRELIAPGCPSRSRVSLLFPNPGRASGLPSIHARAG